MAHHASAAEAVVALKLGEVQPPLLLVADATSLHGLYQDITVLQPSYLVYLDCPDPYTQQIGSQPRQQSAGPHHCCLLLLCTTLA